MTNLLYSCFQKVLFVLTRQYTTVHLSTPALNLNVWQGYRGKNTARYLSKTILFIESEIELLKLTFPQVNRQPDNPQSNNSKVYFIPNSKERLGIDSMGELAISFELSGQFLNDEGNPAPYIHIAHALEQAFNFTFGDAYKSKERVFKRKPFNLAKALDYLRNLIIRESRKKKMKKDESVSG